MMYLSKSLTAQLIFLALIIIITAPRDILAHVKLNAPNGGEMLFVGTHTTIEWEVLIEHETIDWSLSYSVNGSGGPWVTISSSVPAGDISAGTIHMYDWLIPDDVSDNVRVRVIQNNVGPDYIDFSDADLSIAAPDTATFCFLIEPEQANSCAGTGSSAAGFGIAVINPEQTALEVYIEHDVVGVTGIQIRNAPACSDGSAVFSFAGTTSPVSETWALTPSDVTALFSGNLYVNIETGAFPGEEIRGQIVQRNIPMLFTLDEAQVVAGTGSFASGYGYCLLKGDGSELTLDVNHDVPIGDVTAADIRIGAPGVSGPAVFPLPDGSIPISDTWMLTADDIKNLLGARLYVDIRTTAFPDGEIRGQIVQDDFNYTFALKESGTNAAHGFCVVTTNTALDELSLYCEHDAVSPIVGFISYGESFDGSPAYSINSVTSPISQTFALTPGKLDSLLAGHLYVDIHSTEYNDGQIRGTIEPVPTGVSFALTPEEANACSGSGSGASGSVDFTVNPGGKEAAISVNHDVVSPTGVSVGNATQCAAGTEVFAFSPEGVPIRATWYLSPDDLKNFMRNELYLELSSGTHPDGDIRGQVGPVIFVCGDANADGGVNVGDAVSLINFIFKSGAAPDPITSGDANCDNGTNVGDAVYIINFVFKGGSEPCCP